MRSIDHLDEDTQAYIKALRQEAAQHRIERNEVRTELEGAMTLLRAAAERLRELGDI